MGLFLYLQRVRRLERQHAAQQIFSHRLLDLQEQDRKRIAGELHDGLAQNILVVKNAALLGLSPQTPVTEMLEYFHTISGVASQALEEVRDVAHHLRPFQLDQLGLSKAIQALVSRVRASTLLEVIVEMEFIDLLLDPKEEIHFYRIVQESLNNVIKTMAKDLICGTEKEKPSHSEDLVFPG